VQQCGNGARCFVRFVHDQGLTPKREIRVETASGIIVPKLEDDGRVTVNMGPPRFEPEEIPFQAAAPGSHLCGSRWPAANAGNFRAFDGQSACGLDRR
jgi:diaminopimelate epimerase